VQSPISAAANRRARFGRLVINRVIICYHPEIRSPLPAPDQRYLPAFLVFLVVVRDMALTTC
jgi:hypothetical protein